LTVRDTIRRAISDEMRRDEKVIKKKLDNIKELIKFQKECLMSLDRRESSILL
jgi:hypothetical protein